MDNSRHPPPVAPKACAPGRRCHDFRACDHCARIRQARIADAAEALAQLAGPLDWTTIQPADRGQEAAKSARDRWLREAKPAGAIWTVERSPASGALHCNVLTPAGLPPRLDRGYQHRICRIDSPRDVAAYISKRAQLPPRDLYDGRLWGAAGPLWRHLLAAGAPPQVQAAALQRDLSAGAGAPASIPPPLPPVPVDQLTPDEYRQVMARRLPDLVSLRRSLGRLPAPYGRGGWPD